MLEQDEHGDHRFIGLVVQAGSWTIYHSGDRITYDGLVDRLRNWKIDLALLPINGRDPRRAVAGNFSAEAPRSLENKLMLGWWAPVIMKCSNSTPFLLKGLSNLQKRLDRNIRC